MVSSLNDNNNNAMQKSLKVKDRERKARSFMQRLGLSPANSKQQQQLFPPPIPSHATNATHNSNIAFNSAHTRPVLSSPRLLAAFGHNQGIGAPGQHPSNYPLHMVTALERAGVPLPASDLVRKSFEIPTPNEGTASMDDGVPKIRLNLSDVCSPLDFIPEPEPMPDVTEREQSPVMPKAVHKSIVNPVPVTTDDTGKQTYIASSRRHRRQRDSLRKKRMSKFSISTESTVSSSEFSLSVALAPPDCINGSNPVHNSQNLVSAYAVAHAHAPALGSPLAISTASISVRGGGLLRRALSTGDFELEHEGTPMEHDQNEEDLNSHVLTTSQSTHLGWDADLQLDDVLLHTPTSRTKTMEDRKRHDHYLTGETSDIDTSLTKRTSLKDIHCSSHRMQCKDEDHNDDQMIFAQDQDLTPNNGDEFQSPPIDAGTLSIHNGMHGTGKRRKRIKSVVNMAMAEAIACQQDHVNSICQTPQTPRKSTIQPRTQEAKKRYQGSPPPKWEEIDSPIEAVPSTPMRYKILPEPTIGLRSLNVLSEKCETEMKQVKSCDGGGGRVVRRAANYKSKEDASFSIGQQPFTDQTTAKPKQIRARLQYAKDQRTSLPVQVNSAAKTAKRSDKQDTNKWTMTKNTFQTSGEMEEAKFPTGKNDRYPNENSSGSEFCLTQTSNDVKSENESSLRASQSAQEDGIQWQFVNKTKSSIQTNEQVNQTFAAIEGQDKGKHNANASRIMQRERMRRSYCKHRSTEEDQRRRSVYCAFERKGINNADQQQPIHVSVNEIALDSASLQTNKQISSHKNLNRSREGCVENFSDKVKTENVCRKASPMHKDAHHQSSPWISQASREGTTIAQIARSSPASGENLHAILVPPNAQNLLTDQQPKQTNVKQKQSHLEESSVFNKIVHENCLEELNVLQSDVRFTQEDLLYRRQISDRPCFQRICAGGNSMKNFDNGACTSVKDSAKTFDMQFPQIKAQNELCAVKQIDSGDGLFSSHREIHRWALDQTENEKSVHDLCLFSHNAKHELGMDGTDKLDWTKAEKSMGKSYGSESDLASVFENAVKTNKQKKVNRYEGCFNEIKYKDERVSANLQDSKDQSFPPYSFQSRTRSYTLSSLCQSVGESRPTLFTSELNRQSVSSIAPTLVTALASLPSDRFLEFDNDLSTNVNLSSWSLNSSADEFEIPGSFDKSKSSPNRKGKMTSLHRSKSLQSLVRKREKKQASSPLRSSEGSVSDTFKSACSEKVMEQQMQSSSSRTPSGIWQQKAYSEEGSVTSPRLLMMQKQKAQLRASHLIDNPSQQAQEHASSRQTSFFDQISTEHEDDEENFREAHRVHRRCSSDITAHNALLKGLGLRSDSSVKTEQAVLPPARPVPRSNHASKSSETFLNDLGCWMEETEELKTEVLNDRKAIVEEIASCASLSSEQFESAIEDSSVRVNSNRRSAAPPVPPRRRVQNRDLANLDGNQASGKAVYPAASDSSDSWSRLSKVPMYVRLGHLPNRLIDAPSTMSWRSRIGQAEYNDLLQKFDQREMHRQEVIEELYVTEHNFIVQVTSILRTFSEPLRFSDYAFHDSVPVEVARLFHDLDVILAVHVRMFKALDANIKAHPSSLVVSLADAIKPMIDSLAAYQSYLIRYDSVIKLLESLSISSDKGSLSWFAETMDKQASLDECKGLGFGSFLLKPVQRLMKYPLFFKQLDELMDEAHPDKNATTTLYRATERLIGNMNAVKAREEDFELITSLEQRISGLPEGVFLANRQRKLIKQGEIRCVRLTEMERLTLLERSKWESPSINGQSPLLSCFDSAAQYSTLRRLSLLGSSPGSSPALLENEPGFESGSASGCSTSSVSASTPSAGSNVTISSTMTSPALSSTYFDFKVSDEASDKDAAEQQSNAQAPKRKSVAGFLLRGNNSSQTPPLPSLDAGNKGINRVHEEEELYVFVFDDICVLTKRDARSLKVKKKGTAPTTQTKRGPNNVKEDLDTYTALGYIGMSKILAVQQWKNALMGHSDVLEVEVMPMKSEFGSKTGLTGTITFYFEFDSATNQGSQWHQSFERSFCTSIQARKERSTSANSSTKEMDKKIAAQLEWRRREKHIAEVVNNAALAVDRVNLAALLQAGLPFPRSPSQQNLADVAFRTAAIVESCGLDVGKKKEAFIDRQRATSSGQAFSTSPTSPNPIRPSLSKLRHANSNPSLRQAAQAAAISASRQIDIESIPRIGDMNAMCSGTGMGAIVSWEQDRQEERKWWRLRLREVEKENERQEEVDKIVELRRSRVSMPSPSLHASNMPAFDQSVFSPNRSANTMNNTLSGFEKTNENGAMDAFHFTTPSSARSVRTNKVRKGLPILKIN